MKRPLTLSLRALVIFVLIVSGTTASKAQYYDFTASSGAFTALTDPTAIGFADGTDDALSDEIALPFTFSFFGADYNALKVSTNGFITFDVSSSNYRSFNSISADGTPIVAPLWDDLAGGVAAAASYQVTGNSGSRVFTVEWLRWSWDWNADNESISFQVKLYEGSQKIEFIYKQEFGAVEDPGASIGIASGNPDNHFFSLADASSNPQLDDEGENYIHTKPATGQTYTFTPAAVPVTPLVQVSDVAVSNLEGKTLTINWTNGDGTSRVVFMKQTSSTSELLNAVDSKQYVGNSEFETESSYVGGFGWYCVYSGTGSSVDISNLRSTTQYRIQVLEFNGAGGFQKYLSTTSAENVINVTTPLAAPGSPESTMAVRFLGSNAATVAIFDGDGSKSAVFVKEGTSGIPPVVDNTTYDYDSEFGSGDQVGTSGWFCVGNLTFSDELTITNLLPGHNYRIAVVDYNGSPGNELYNATSVTDNPIQIQTYQSDPSTNDYTLTKSITTFTELVSATALDYVEADDHTSSSIAIGFPFIFDGISFTTVQVSSNGFLTFSPFDADYSFNNYNDLPQTSLRPLVAPLWDDLSGIGGEASYQTSGAPGSRVFTVQFKNWKWNYQAASAGISFQIKLFEGSNNVQVIYRQEAGALNSPAASIGLAFKDLGDFISLNSASASAVASNDIATNSIDSKPETGQVFTFIAPKQDQTISFTAPEAKVFNDAAFSLEASASSGLPVSFESSDTNVASISGSTVTIKGVGTISIIATQAGNDNYNAAPSVERSLTIAKASQVITFNALESKKYGSGNFELGATSTSGLAVSYESSNTAVATVSGKVVTIVGVGTTSIIATQAGNANFNPAPSVEKSLTITKGDQIITFQDIPEKSLGAANFDLEAASNTNTAITFQSSNEAVATISGHTVTIKGAGTSEITASQAATPLYNATSVVKTLTVSPKLHQTISFAALDVKHYGDADFNVTATASSGLAITLSSSNTDVATISDNKVTIKGVGTTTLTASQSGNDGYFAADEKAQVLTIEKGDQTISFNAFEHKITIGEVVELTGSSSAGLTITYISSDPSIISVSGNKITGVAGGKATITASQGGSSLYNAAASVARETGVYMKQTITLTKIGDHTVGDTPFKLKATSSSGLPVSFTSNTVKILLQGENHDEVVIQEAGTVTIVAHQEGNADFAAASDVSETICVKPAKPTITVSDNGNGEPLLTSSSGSANQWFKDEKAISGATLPFLSVEKNGSYTVQVTVNDCANISDAEEIVITAIEDHDGNVKIYPNPVTDQFIVDVSGLALKRNAQVNITDLSGRQLNSWEGKGKITCNIGGFSQGTYILNISVGKEKISRQLSKK
jgi:hypothetical protein